ncbi:MAG: dienelactone hydrolase family protein, partial [Candidatus Rokuibacteriota bacterium]
MAQWDRIDVDGSAMRLYVGMPSLGRAFPAVIVIQHGPGVDKFIEDRVENLAQQGYLAIAPDLYHRQTEDGDVMTRIGRLRDAEVINDVNAAVNYARRLKDT